MLGFDYHQKKSGVHEQRHACLALITGTLHKGKKNSEANISKR